MALSNAILVGTQVPSLATVANNTWTSLEFVTTADHNLGGWTGLNSTSLTVPETGYYLVTAGMWGGATNGVSLGLRINVEAVNRREVNFSSGANNTQILPLVDIMYLTADDAITIQVYQNTGGALAYGNTATPTLNGSYFAAHRMDADASPSVEGGLSWSQLSTKGRVLLT